MKLLANNYAYQFRNKPHTFHNGGLWPVWNGFLLACMKNKKQEVEQRIYQALVQACRHSLNPENKYEFNECLHGQTSEPNGLPFCSWSAAGLILANNGFYEN
jgi:glycogen debranching enzyme